MEIVKPNDIFVTSTLTPDVNVYDLHKSQILANNTSFFDKETYRNTDFVKKAYTDAEGKFDDIKFNDAYNRAASLYTDLSNDNYLKNNIQWDAYDFYRPADSKTRKEALVVEKDINPYQNLYGRTGFDSIDAGPLSKRELAQQSNIWDPALGKFSEKTPNSLGILGSLFSDTMVYAKWDKDGYHQDPISKREVFHSKGEDKLNADGNFYTEFLRDREIYGKEVVNPTDLITTDTSYWNKVDFFDSDGRTKSMTGTTFKIAAEMTPFLIPGFNLYYGGMKMALGLSTVMPTFYKALEGILLGDTTARNETDLWKAANKAEGFMAKYGASSYSDEASGSLWNYEQLGGMVGDIFAQIYEQRAAASLSKMFYSANKMDVDEYTKLSGTILEDVAKGSYAGTITKEGAESITQKAAQKAMELSGIGKKQSNLAKSLSLGYMALTSTADIYGQALAGGFDRRAAGIAAMLAATGQYGIMMNNRMSTWFLDEAVGFNAEANKAAIRKGIIPKLEEIQKAVGVIETNPKAGKKMLAGIVSGLKKNLFEPMIASSSTEAIYRNGIVEGVEEVTEQMVLDASKGAMDAMSWLGIFKGGSFDTINQVFSKQGFDNYLANLVGGVIGGGLFEINRLKEQKTPFKKATKTESDYALLRGIANGKASEYKAEAAKMVNILGISNLSPTSKKENGQEVYTENETVSQATTVLGAFNNYIDNLDYILNSENLKQDNTSLVKKTILDEIVINKMMETGVESFILSDFNILASEIVDIKKELQSLDKTKDAEQISKLNESLKLKQEERDTFLNGEKASYYKELATFSLSKLHEPFVALNVHDYTKSVFNQDYDSLPEIGGDLSKQSVKEKFDQLMDTPSNKKDKMKLMYSAFKTMVGKYSNDILAYTEEKHINSRQERDARLQTVKILSPESVKSFQHSLNANSLAPFNLSDILDIPLGTLLSETGKLDTTNLTEEEIQAQVNFLNNTEIPVQDLNPNFIRSVAIGSVAPEIAKIDEDIANVNLEEISDEEKAVKIKELTDKKIVLAKLVPVWKDPNTVGEKLNLDSIYLYQQLKDKPYITSEEAEIVSTRQKELFNKAKEKLNHFLNTSLIAEDLSVEDTLLAEAKTSKDLEAIKKSIIESLKDQNTIDTFGLTPIDIETELNSLPDINPDLVNAETLLDKEILDNQFLQILSTMNLDIFASKNSNQLSILDLLQSELKVFETRPKPQDYVRNNKVIKDMKQALTVLNLFDAITTSMLDTSIDVMNPFGLSASMKNSFIKEGKPEEAAKYPSITGESYIMLNKELARIKSKLEYLVELAEQNNETIINRDKKIKENTLTLMYNALKDVDNITSPINIIVNGHPLLSNDDINKVESSGKVIEEKLLDLEEIIYNNFNTNRVGSMKEALDDLFKESLASFTKSEEILQNQPAALSADATSLTQKNWMIYLHTILAANSKDFYKKYKDILKNELSLSDKKVPFYTQEYALRIAYAYLTNKPVMSHVIGALDEKRVNKNTSNISLKNLLMITGIGGVGKTTISNFILKMLDTETVIAAGPNQRVYNNLKESITRDSKKEVIVGSSAEIFNTLGVKELYQEFNAEFGRLKEHVAANKIAKDAGKVAPTNSLDNLKTFTVTDLDSIQITLTQDFKDRLIAQANELKEKTVIFYDEVSWLNYLELQIINTLADSDNISFIGLGDPTQKGFNLSPQIPFSMELTNYLSPPELKGVIRANNIHQADNVAALSLLIKKTADPTWVPQVVTEITYSEKDNILHGEKFVEELTDKDLSKFEPTKGIAIINNDGKVDETLDSKLKALGFTDIIFISLDQVQGDQFDQVIYTGTIPYSDTSDIIMKRSAFKDLYTLISRPKQSALIVGNKEILNYIKAENSVRKYTAKIDFEMAELGEILDARLDFMDKLTYPEESDKKVVKVLTKVPTPNAVINPISTDDTDTELLKKEDKIDPDDKKYFAYSFFNVLHANISDKGLDIKPLEGKDPSDLQVLGPIVTLTRAWEPDKLAESFIHVKNILLHQFAGIKYSGSGLAGNPFAKLLQAKEGTLVVRNLTYDNKFIRTYGKQAHVDGEEPKPGTVLPFLTYKGKLDGKPFYITLAALPNTKNAKYTQTRNKTFFEETFSGNEEVELKGTELIPYSGIRRIFNDGTTFRPTNKSNPIEITGNTFDEFVANLKAVAPGLQIEVSNNIEVFSNSDLGAIQGVFSKVGYTLPGTKNVLKTPEVFKGRPYIKVSYIDPNDNTVSRIIPLSARSRSLKEALEEFKTTKGTLDFKGDIVPLISTYQGATLLGELLTKGSETDTKTMISAIIENQKTRNAAGVFTVTDETNLRKVLELIASVKGVLKSLSTEDKNSVLKYDYRELGFILFDILKSNNSLVDSIISDPQEGKISWDTNVYYDPAWISTHSEKTTGSIKADDIKYYKIDTYLEPPKFMLDLSNFNKPVEVAKEVPVVPPAEISVDFTQDGLIVTPIGDITISANSWRNWNPTNLDKAVFIFNSLLKEIEISAKDIKNPLNPAQKEQLDTINREIYSKLINNSSTIKTNGNLDALKVRNAIDVVLTPELLASSGLGAIKSNILGMGISKSLATINSLWQKNPEKVLIKNKCN